VNITADESAEALGHAFKYKCNVAPLAELTGYLMKLLPP
jgi:hypothetical protein